MSPSPWHSGFLLYLCKVFVCAHSYQTFWTFIYMYKSIYLLLLFLCRHMWMRVVNRPAKHCSHLSLHFPQCHHHTLILTCWNSTAWTLWISFAFINRWLKLILEKIMKKNCDGNDCSKKDEFALLLPLPFLKYLLTIAVICSLLANTQ